MKVRAFHGTDTPYDGYPTRQTDVYGFTGIFLTEDKSDAWHFAELATEGRRGGRERVYAADVDLTGALDLTGVDDVEDLVRLASDTDAAVVILPDLSGTSNREILVKDSDALRWSGVDEKDDGAGGKAVEVRWDSGLTGVVGKRPAPNLAEPVQSSIGDRRRLIDSLRRDLVASWYVNDSSSDDEVLAVAKELAYEEGLDEYKGRLREIKAAKTRKTPTGKAGRRGGRAWGGAPIR